jgi:hypothetical protein
VSKIIKIVRILPIVKDKAFVHPAHSPVPVLKFRDAAIGDRIEVSVILADLQMAHTDFLDFPLTVSIDDDIIPVMDRRSNK